MAKTSIFETATANDLLGMIRARKRAGLTMTARGVRSLVIEALARRHYGGWYQAVEAAGLRPDGKPTHEAIPPRKRVVKLTEELLRGPLSSAELERLTGVLRTSIQDRRLRRGIARNEHRAADRGWVPEVRKLFGKIPDAEIARRVGKSATVVSYARHELGIRAALIDRPGTDLDDVGREGTLLRVRARSRSGRSMRAGDMEDHRLMSLCRRFFGGWYQAVEAAGLKPEGKPRSVAPPPPRRKRALTEALLRGPLSSAELERRTGVWRKTIQSKRQNLGLGLDESQKADRSWVPAVRKLMGKVPDTEIVRRTGKSPMAVSRARRELGIPAPPRAALARDPRIGAMLRRYRPRDIERAVDELDRTSAVIFRERYTRPSPPTLLQIGRQIGLGRENVWARERRALVRVLAWLVVNAKPRSATLGERR